MRIAALLQILRALRSALRFPSIEDEAALREFLGTVLETAARLAAFTPTTLDDAAVRGLAAAIADDRLWTLLYRLLRWAASENDLLALADASGLSSDELLSIRNEVHEAIHLGGRPDASPVA
ncbi:hypothetical protein [Thermopirellula anaerolimosa]